MYLATVRLIFWRELRDQLRDRRTLVTVLVLPLLIYPLLSIGLVQVAQLASAPSSRIWFVGAEDLPTQPALIEGNRLRRDLLPPQDWDLTSLELESSPSAVWQALRTAVQDSTAGLPAEVERQLREELARRRCDLMVLVPPGFAQAISEPKSTARAELLVLRNSVESSSAIAAQRFQRALDHWNGEILRDRLARLQIDLSNFQTAQAASTDLAGSVRAAAVQWSRILPLVLVIWALTGAFYPAIDLVAGEKERGTLETLLSSPASRLEIVGGKLLTVMSFSAATALLNLVSLLLCGMFVSGPLERLTGSAPLGALPAWQIIPVLLLALLLISALFSSLALAAAAFARSSKEGQYYLMPLIMVALPLMLVAHLPGIRLGFGTALLPLSGLLLLIQAVVEENWSTVGLYFGPVVAITLVACWAAIRWCTYQFNDEKILFSSVERLSLRDLVGRWNRSRRGPTVGVAVTCGLGIVVARFFVGFAVSPALDWTQFWQQTSGVLVLTVGLPTVLLAFACSRDLRRSLSLTRSSGWLVLQAALLAVMLHPALMAFSKVVLWVFPLPAGAGQADVWLNRIFLGAPGFWAIVAVVAVAPALWEELAFRGLILNGFRSQWRIATSIVASSFLFGAAHGVLQQSIVTFVIGIVLGFLAIRGGSVWPCMAYHAVHNSLSIGMARLDVAVIEQSRWLSGLWLVHEQAVAGYRPQATVSATLLAIILLWVLFRPESPNAVSQEGLAWPWALGPSSAKS